MTALLWVLALAANTAGAQEQLAEPLQVQVQATGPVLRAGTPVPMATMNPISSRNARQGQRLALEVVEDVAVDGMVVIPRGSRGAGEVARVVEKGMFGKSGKLEVRVLFVELGGRRIRLDGRALDKGKSSVGTAAAAVVLIGPLGGFLTGKNAVIPAASPVIGHVYEDLPLKPATAH